MIATKYSPYTLIINGKRPTFPVTIVISFIGLFLLFQLTWHSDVVHRFSSSSDPDRTWLVATISPAYGAQRRAMIRSTWQAKGKGVPMTTRFIVADPGPLWEPLITAENNTYGDIVVLKNITENGYTANTVKTMELFKYLVTEKQKYTFVSKIDDDSYISPRLFYNKYLTNILNSTDFKPAERRTVIGRRYVKDTAEGKTMYPQGGFYTMTWEMVKVLNDLQQKYNVTDRDEDWLIATLLNMGIEHWQFIHMEGQFSFDYHKEDARNETTAMAKKDSDQKSGSHAVGRKAVHVHWLKEDSWYMMVNQCFDENGVKQSAWDDDEWL